jgi:hypothetical protein
MKEFMESVLLAFCITVPILIFVFEFASFMTYGWFIKNDVLEEALDHHIPNGCTINPYDLNIITIGNMPFISTCKADVLGKYYVDGVGRVSRFSSAHKRIANIHKELKRRWIAENTPEKTIREKLNIK